MGRRKVAVAALENCSRFKISGLNCGFRDGALKLTQLTGSPGFNRGSLPASAELISAQSCRRSLGLVYPGLPSERGDAISAASLVSSRSLQREDGLKRPCLPAWNTGRDYHAGYGPRFFSSSRICPDSDDVQKGSSGPFVGSIKKVLIANRGEIACRIIKTCKMLGVESVAVFSDQDRNAMHVRQADEAVYIGPSPASSSYLNGPAILSAARSTGAHAIHPGYGFLSENVQFAELCKEQGISFIGPPSSAIHAMGDKSVSKRMMAAAGVPVVPGYHGEDQRTELLKHEADKIGYPVLIKATQGGGGKGMRIVPSPEQFLECLAGAKREAKAAFGDDRVLVEKYLSRPRHIEVQIFGDKQGNIVHLYERDCSVQRRHQKIIEESPAPHITEEFRNRIGQAAVDAARAVGYESAGTVEFIVDTRTGEFYFMEMNTRLQVEHPVTEMVTKQDLVEWQIRVANGERLPLFQDELSLSGHAFEARIYAENVPKGFLPATGTLRHFRPPLTSETVRVETGVDRGDTVSIYYDPMIAKLVVWGHNRQAALTKLHRSLTEFQIAGLPNNIGFLTTLSSYPAFEAGEVETHFIEHFKSDLLPAEDLSIGNNLKNAVLSSANVRLATAVAATAVCLNDNSLSEATQHQGVRSIWRLPSLSGFRLNHNLSRSLHLDWMHHSVQSTAIPFAVKVTYGQKLEFEVQVEKEQPLQISVTEPDLQNGSCSFRVALDGVSSSATVAQYKEGGSNHLHLWYGDQHQHFTMPVELYDVDELVEEKISERRYGKTSVQDSGSVTAPMAGRIVKLYVADASVVQKNDPLLVMEAMKMEHVVRAPTSGVISGPIVAVGEQVQDGSVLLNIQVSQ